MGPLPGPSASPVQDRDRMRFITTIVVPPISRGARRRFSGHSRIETNEPPESLGQVRKKIPGQRDTRGLTALSGGSNASIVRWPRYVRAVTVAGRATRYDGRLGAGPSRRTAMGTTEPGAAGLSGAQEYRAHSALHRTIAGQVQRLLALSQLALPKPARDLITKQIPRETEQECAR